MLFGIVHVALVFLSLRLLFPRQFGRQLVGLVLAAFLPMNLYLSHYVTNETSAALLVSVSVYLCLRILKTGTNSYASFSMLGFVIGAAVLTKFTAVVAIPFIVGALAGQVFARRALD
jgi:4-amino-4-deoxy-L-arabinose transferase-like glycosyltransferase